MLLLRYVCSETVVSFLTED